MSRNNKLPAGCTIPLLIVMGIIFYLASRDSPEEIKKRNDEHNAFVSKYDYNPDSLAKEFSSVYSNYSETKPVIKPKILVLYDGINGISFNPKGTAHLPDSLIAYKKNELQTIILQSYSKELISNFGEHGVEREQTDLKFIDFKTKTIIYTTTLLGSHKFERKSRRGNTTEYNLYDYDIVSEILKTLNSSK